MLFAYSNPGTLTVHAPAKLNLYLSIDDKRSDGFHEITSLMLSVGIYDTLVFTEEPSAEVELRVTEANSLLTPLKKNRQRIPAGEENLVVRAIRLLQEQTGQHQGIRIELIKRIPAEAGLGGGSSDAAAALFAANKLWRLGLSISELCEIAAKLGSDIPFFLTAKSLNLFLFPNVCILWLCDLSRVYQRRKFIGTVEWEVTRKIRWNNLSATWLLVNFMHYPA